MTMIQVQDTYSEYRSIPVKEVSLRETAPFSPREWVIYYIQGKPGGLPEETVKALRLHLSTKGQKYLVHLPDIIRGDLGRQIAFNFPWLKDGIEEITEMAFYKAAAKKIGVTLDDEHGYFVRYSSKKNTMVYRQVQGTDPESLVIELEKFIDPYTDDNPFFYWMKENKPDKPRHVIPHFRYKSKWPRDGSLYDGLFDDYDEQPEQKGPAVETSAESPAENIPETPMPVRKEEPEIKEEPLTKADKLLPEELEKVSIKARELIRTLLMNDFSKDIIRSWLVPDTRISRVHVTSGYRIMLPDYSGMEIHMTPLVKTVWLFYLMHPEGVKFKELPQHEKQMGRIYSKVANRSSRQDMERSISDLCDPYKDSIIEKVSKIKQAFLAVLPEELAAMYIVQGPAGEAKGIQIDRSLVSADVQI